MKQFHPIESFAIGPVSLRGAVAEERHFVEIVPHFDEIVVRVNEEEHVLPLGNSERILDELSRGNSAEVTILVVLPGSEESVEVKTVWVASRLAGGSKASTLKLLEDTTYRLLGAPHFRGLVGSDRAALVDSMHQFLSSEGEELVVAQVSELVGREGFKWRGKNWYTSAHAV